MAVSSTPSFGGPSTSSFSFGATSPAAGASQTPTSGAPFASSAAGAPSATNVGFTSPTPAAVGGAPGFPSFGSPGGRTPLGPSPVAAASTTTPGRVANPLLTRHAGATPAPSKFSLTSPSPQASVGGSGARSSPAGSVGGGLGGRGRDQQRAVTFAIDRPRDVHGTGPSEFSEGLGLRRRRGGAADGKKNSLGLSNFGGTSDGGIQPPPKASLRDRLSPVGIEQKEGKGDERQQTQTSSSLVQPFPGRGPTDPYATWVVVHGFANNAQYRSLLSRFESYGTVLSRHGSDGSGEGGTNWVCLRYETPLQAEKALCQNGTFLDGGAGMRGEVSIIGVMRVDATLARKLGLSGPEGGTPVVGGFVTSRRTDRSQPTGEKDAVLLEEKDVLLGEHSPWEKGVDLSEGRRDDLCGKLLSWVFSW